MYVKQYNIVDNILILMYTANMNLTIKRNNKVDYKLQTKQNLLYMFEVFCYHFERLQNK